MRIIFLICGMLWMLLGFVLLAVNVSIVSAPESIEQIRAYAYFFIIIFLAAGFYFVIQSKLESKYKIIKKLNRTFASQLIGSGFSMTLFEFASKNKIHSGTAIRYIEKRVKKGHGKLYFTQSSLIYYNYKNNKPLNFNKGIKFGKQHKSV